MNRRWHTNKTKPNAEKCLNIIIIWKDNNISVDTPNVDDFNNLYLIGEGLYWKDIKDDIKYWQYDIQFINNEFKGGI